MPFAKSRSGFPHVALCFLGTLPVLPPPRRHLLPPFQFCEQVLRQALSTADSRREWDPSFGGVSYIDESQYESRSVLANQDDAAGRITPLTPPSSSPSNPPSSDSSASSPPRRRPTPPHRPPTPGALSARSAERAAGGGGLREERSVRLHLRPPLGARWRQVAVRRYLCGGGSEGGGGVGGPDAPLPAQRWQPPPIESRRSLVEVSAGMGGGACPRGGACPGAALSLARRYLPQAPP